MSMMFFTSKEMVTEHPKKKICSRNFVSRMVFGSWIIAQSCSAFAYTFAVKMAALPVVKFELHIYASFVLGRMVMCVDFSMSPLSRPGSRICPIGKPRGLKTRNRPWPHMETYTFPSLSTQSESGPSIPVK